MQSVARCLGLEGRARVRILRLRADVGPTLVCPDLLIGSNCESDFTALRRSHISLPQLLARDSNLDLDLAPELQTLSFPDSLVIVRPGLC